MYYSYKTNIVTKSTFFCKTNLEMKERIFFISKGEKITKNFAKKKFIVFGGAHVRPSITLNLIFLHFIFIFKFYAYEEYTFYHFKIFVNKTLLIWTQYVFSNGYTF